jgi:hypothetical protein
LNINGYKCIEVALPNLCVLEGMLYESAGAAGVLLVSALERGVAT